METRAPQALRYLSPEITEPDFSAKLLRRILIYLGALMTAFPIFYAVLENNIRRVLAYVLLLLSGYYPPEMLAKIEAARKTAAEEYLTRIRDRLDAQKATYHTVVMVGRVAESLVEHAEKTGIDLILIATHGRSGVTRWVRGSVADKILRSAGIPVLMIRAPGTKGGI